MKNITLHDLLEMFNAHLRFQIYRWVLIFPFCINFFCCGSELIRTLLGDRGNISQMSWYIVSQDGCWPNSKSHLKHFLGRLSHVILSKLLYLNSVLVAANILFVLSRSVMAWHLCSTIVITSSYFETLWK